MIIKVATTSTTSVGCTFIDWSLYWLSGQDHIYSTAQQKWLPVPVDPLTGSNAHKHPKNHPSGRAEVATAIAHVERESRNRAGLYSLYPAPTHLADISSLMGLQNTEALADGKKWAAVAEYQSQSLQEVFTACQDHDFSVVYISLDPKFSLFFSIPRAPYLITEKKEASLDEKLQEDQKVFFAKSQKAWQDINLNDIWDQRERMALDMRPYEVLNIDWLPTDPRPYQWINSASLWSNGKTCMKQIIEFCGLKARPEKWDHWSLVYVKWQETQSKNFDFLWRCDYIVDCILNGRDYRVGELTLYQEAIIQHILIYKHGLNLKTWQLSQFPENCIQLHELLEPNSHPVPAIY